MSTACYGINEGQTCSICESGRIVAGFSGMSQLASKILGTDGPRDLSWFITDQQPASPLLLRKAAVVPPVVRCLDASFNPKDVKKTRKKNQVEYLKGGVCVEAPLAPALSSANVLQPIERPSSLVVWGI